MNTIAVEEQSSPKTFIVLAAAGIQLAAGTAFGSVSAGVDWNIAHYTHYLPQSFLLYLLLNSRRQGICRVLLVTLHG